MDIGFTVCWKRCTGTIGLRNIGILIVKKTIAFKMKILLYCDVLRRKDLRKR